MNKYHLTQIDLLKSFSIISVIILHTVSQNFLKNTYAIFYIWQAVPIFIILLGLNSASSFKRNKYKTIAELYSKVYFINRFKRIILPFIFIFFISLFYAKSQNKLNISTSTFIGLLPTPGPGNYYITLLFEFILIFPLIYYVYSRCPKVTILTIFIIDLLFEFIAPHIEFFKTQPYLYDSSVFRYLFGIVLGVWISNFENFDVRDKSIIFIGTSLSIIYLLLSSVLNFKFLYFLPNWINQNLFTFFYPTLIVLMGIKFLPKCNDNVIIKIFTIISKSSYHIFLVQIVFFFHNHTLHQIL